MKTNNTEIWTVCETPNQIYDEWQSVFRARNKKRSDLLFSRMFQLSVKEKMRIFFWSKQLLCNAIINLSRTNKIAAIWNCLASTVPKWNEQMLQPQSCTVNRRKKFWCEILTWKNYVWKIIPDLCGSAIETREQGKVNSAWTTTEKVMIRKTKQSSTIRHH